MPHWHQEMPQHILWSYCGISAILGKKLNRAFICLEVGLKWPHHWIQLLYKTDDDLNSKPFISKA